MANILDVTVSATLPWPELTANNAVVNVQLSGVEPAIVTFDNPSVIIDVHLSGVAPVLQVITGAKANVSTLLGTTIPHVTAITGRVASVNPILSSTLPELTVSSGRVVTIAAILSGVVPSINTTLHGNVSISAILSGVLPSIISLGTFTTICVTPGLRGVSEYSNYGFNSFFELDGNWYGINSVGIYILSGTTDAGTAISAYLDSGDVEYAKGQRSRIVDAHLLGRTNGTMSLTLYEDDGAGNTYTSIGGTDGTMQNHRFKPGKGAEGVRYRYRLANVPGGTLEAQELRLLVAESARKR